jgi:hypothetical protein
MYHTQEKRDKRLTKPVICKRPDAWLGTAYYFWHDIYDAHKWGDKSKKATGHYEIYQGEIDCESVLDTVFSEETYIWWLEQIELASKEIKKLSTGNKKPTLKQLNDYFKNQAKWGEDVTGVLFQDIPEGYDYSLIEPTMTRNGPRYFAYKKRIQLALYKLSYLKKFSLIMTQKCKTDK